jgi:hypothetical protein
VGSLGRPRQGHTRPKLGNRGERHEGVLSIPPQWAAAASLCLPRWPFVAFVLLLLVAPAGWLMLTLVWGPSFRLKRSARFAGPVRLGG